MNPCHNNQFLKSQESVKQADVAIAKAKELNKTMEILIKLKQQEWLKNYNNTINSNKFSCRQFEIRNTRWAM